MDIPFSVERRKDTGMYNALLGTWLFLASEVMLFGALFTTYILLRLGSEEWPGVPGLLDMSTGISVTAILLASSVTMILAVRALRRGRPGIFRAAALSTMLLGAGFILLKGLEYRAHFAAGELPSSNTFFGIYFVLTGLHVIHVIAGLLLLAWLTRPGNAMRNTDPGRFTHRVEITGIYWHFLNVIWLFIFPALYLL